MCVVLWCPNCLRTGTTVVSSVRVSVCPCVCLCDVRGLGEKSPEIYRGTRKGNVTKFIEISLSLF